VVEIRVARAELKFEGLFRALVPMRSIVFRRNRLEGVSLVLLREPYPSCDQTFGPRPHPEEAKAKPLTKCETQFSIALCDVTLSSAVWKVGKAKN
jgi:hypothetical protein